jgi:hypothetical protein
MMTRLFEVQVYEYKDNAFVCMSTASFIHTVQRYLDLISESLLHHNKLQHIMNLYTYLWIFREEVMRYRNLCHTASNVILRLLIENETFFTAEQKQFVTKVWQAFKASTNKIKLT